MKLSIAGSLLCVCLALSTPVQALDAGDVLNRMPTEQRKGYIIGLSHMHSYHAILSGDRSRAECMIRSTTEGGALERIYAAFERWPDKPAEGLVVLILNKACAE